MEKKGLGSEPPLSAVAAFYFIFYNLLFLSFLPLQPSITQSKPCQNS